MTTYLGAYLGAMLVPLKPPALFVAPTARGNGSGGSWSNAAAFGQLNSLMAIAAVSGSEILLAAHLGDYVAPSTMSLTNGGTAARPIVIRGADAAGDPAEIVMRGTRTRPWSPGSGGYGQECFWFNGASHVAMSGIRFEDIGICIRLRAACTNMTFTDMACYNVGRFLQNLQGGTASAPATVTKLRIARITADYISKTGIFLRYDTNDVIAEDCDFNFRSIDGDRISCGYIVYDTAHNILWRRCIARNAYNAGPGNYWNGDGFSSERENYDIRCEDTQAWNMTDRGYDMKSSGTVMIRAFASGCKRNWAFWEEALMIDCIGRDPFKRGGTGSSAHVTAMQNSSRVRIQNCDFDSRGTSPSGVFTVIDRGFLAYDQATADKIRKRSDTPIRHTERFKGPVDDDYGYTIWDHADTARPVYTGPASFVFNENIQQRLKMMFNEVVYLQIDGPDADKFTISGRLLVLPAQDFEKPGGAGADGTNVLRIRLRGVDANRNVSDWTPLAFLVQDVNDNPIAPEEAFALSGARGGFWYDISRTDTLWADAAQTIPAEIGGPVCGITDLGPYGNHARQDNPDAAPILTDLGGYLGLYFDGGTHFLNIGAPGSLRFASLTAFIAFIRDSEDGGTTSVLLNNGERSRTNTTSANVTFRLGAQGGSFADWNCYAPGQGGNISGGLNDGAFPDKGSVISFRSADGQMRLNGGSLASDGTDVATINYPVADNQPMLGARRTRDSAGVAGIGTYFQGYIFGAAEFDVPVPSNPANDLRNRIERQFGREPGIVF